VQAFAQNIFRSTKADNSPKGLQTDVAKSGAALDNIGLKNPACIQPD
jgi:hypothetical protein